MRFIGIVKSDALAVYSDSIDDALVPGADHQSPLFIENHGPDVLRTRIEELLWLPPGFDLVNLPIRRSAYVQRILAVDGESHDVELIEIRKQGALSRRIHLIDLSIVTCAEVDIAFRIGRSGQNQSLLSIEDHVVPRRKNQPVIAGQ